MRRSIVELDQGVAALGDFSREQLAALWQTAHGHPPPKGICQELLVRSAAWQLQVKRLGGLSPSTRRLLKSAMADVERTLSIRTARKTCVGDDTVVGGRTDDLTYVGVASDGFQPASAKPRRATLSPGARLVRDWNGKTHVVDVIEEGYVFQATVHKSLTAIAHQITGAHWSGPRFFGL